jgi:hypothetical protein
MSALGSKQTSPVSGCPTGGLATIKHSYMHAPSVSEWETIDG